MLHEWEIRSNEFIPSEFYERGIMIRSSATRIGDADDALVLDRAAAEILWKALSERVDASRLERTAWTYPDEGLVYFRWIMSPVAGCPSGA